MKTRFPCYCIIVCVLVVQAIAKDKKPIMPASVLQAETIAVIIEPGAGDSITGDNKQAREEVESALRKWGRYDVQPFPENADLIVAVRRSSSTLKPTIGPPPNDRPVVLGPGTPLPDGSMSTTIGIGVGTPPPMTSGPKRPPGLPGTEAGPAEDTFEVYRGTANLPADVGPPLDAPPLWRYIGKNALSAPNVKAVQEFRKAVEDATKAQNTQTQKKP
jgi:hypothetical protein